MTLTPDQQAEQDDFNKQIAAIQAKESQGLADYKEQMAALDPTSSNAATQAQIKALNDQESDLQSKFKGEISSLQAASAASASGSSSAVEGIHAGVDAQANAAAAQIAALSAQEQSTFGANRQAATSTPDPSQPAQASGPAGDTAGATFTDITQSAVTTGPASFDFSQLLLGRSQTLG